MIIQLITIGKNMPNWVEASFNDYQKRLPRHFALELTELPLEKRSKNSNIDKIKAQEAQSLLAACHPQGLIIALDEQGQQKTTRELAQAFENWQTQYRSINLLVGGPDGLATTVKQQANVCLSLSKLTLPHPLVRVIIAEQIYRVYSIITRHPYHRD